MKKSGNICEFKQQRILELNRLAGRWIAKNGATADVKALFQEIVKQPASRFFVSEERARMVVGAMERDPDALERMNPAKQRMYREIYRRYKHERSLHPQKSVISIMIKIVNSPAPEFYLEGTTAREYCYSLFRK